MAPIFHSKAVCQYYYSVLNDSAWQCRKCSKQKSKNGGWTNLLSHLKSCIGKDYSEQYAVHMSKTSVLQGSSSCLDTYVLSLNDAEKEMAEWINYIVVKNLPVSIVDCPLTRNIVKLKPVSSKSIRKHVLSLANILVREEIKVRLPDRFVIVFDGWTEGTDHYVGISASYNIMTKETRTVNGIHHVDSKETTIQSLLSMRPLLACRWDPRNDSKGPHATHHSGVGHV
jgi:hypothetical protein